MGAICSRVHKWTTQDGRALVEYDEKSGRTKIPAYDLSREEVMLVEKILGDIIRDWGAET